MSDFIPLGRMLHEEHVRTLALMNALDSRTTGGSASDRSTPPIPTTGNCSNKPSPPSTRRSSSISASRNPLFFR